MIVRRTSLAGGALLEQLQPHVVCRRAGIVPRERVHEPARRMGTRMSPRATWLDELVDVFLTELDDLGLVASRTHVVELIGERVAAVATEIGVGQRTARRYFTPDAVRELARELAVTLADEQPGADILEGPRTIPMAPSSVGRTIAALAEAAHIRVLNDDSVGAHGALQVISLLGQVLSSANLEASDAVLLPPAALTRGARLLEATAAMIRAGVTVVSGLPDEATTAVADAFTCDAATLRILLDGHGTHPGPAPGS